MYNSVIFDLEIIKFSSLLITFYTRDRLKLNNRGSLEPRKIQIKNTIFEIKYIQVYCRLVQIYSSNTVLPEVIKLLFVTQLVR